MTSSSMADDSAEMFDEQIEELCVEEAKEQSIHVKFVMEQIFKSPLKKYVPPLSPDHFDPKDCYSCEECGDKFIVKKSLETHMERRSVLITYDCAECSTTITVFNRCSLLSHFRFHLESEYYVCDPSKIHVAPIPYEMFIGPMNKSPTYESEQTVNSNNVVPESVNVTDVDLCNGNNKYCVECGEQVQGTLRDHFVGANVPIDSNLKCKACNLILSTRCSMKAHERYHKREEPFICPECAKLFRDWDLFLLHISVSCFHLEKCVHYECPCCEVLNPSNVALQTHMCTKHIKIVYKCNVCPIACFSKPALQAHKARLHGSQTLSSIKSYRQCQLCPDILLQESFLLSHIIEHIKNPTLRTYGYKCNACNISFQKKHNFATHKKKCCEKQKTAYIQTYVHNMKTLVTQLPAPTVFLPTVAKGSSEPKSRLIGNNIINFATSKNLSTNKVRAVDGANNLVNNATTASYQVFKVNKRSGGNSDVVTAKKGEEMSPMREFSGVKNNGSWVICSCAVCNKELVFSVPRSETSNLNFSVQCATCKKVGPNKKKVQDKPEPVNKNGASLSVPSKTGKELPASIIEKLKRGNSNNIAVYGPANKKCKSSSNSLSCKEDKFKCHICHLSISTDWNILQDHFSKKHKDSNLLFLSPRLKKLDIDTEAGLPVKVKINVMEESAQSKNKSNPSVSGTKQLNTDVVSDSLKSKCKKKAVRKEKQNVPSPLVSGQVVSSVKTNGKYTCSSCNLVCDDAKRFHLHIATHKTDGCMYQCMECGMCFVVKPSFQKHLIISHHIKNVDQYIQENRLCYQKPDNEPEDSTDNVQENQCRVCFQQFDDTVQLNKHFRTHGMAFLSMNRREVKPS